MIRWTPGTSPDDRLMSSRKSQTLAAGASTVIVSWKITLTNLSGNASGFYWGRGFNAPNDRQAGDDGAARRRRRPPHLWQPRYHRAAVHGHPAGVPAGRIHARPARG